MSSFMNGADQVWEPFGHPAQDKKRCPSVENFQQVKDIDRILDDPRHNLIPFRTVYCRAECGHLKIVFHVKGQTIDHREGLSLLLSLCVPFPLTNEEGS